MKFDIGDSVVCINDDLRGINGVFEIKKNNIYTIRKITTIVNNNSFLIYLNEVNSSYSCDRFISLYELRKQKINKIKDKINVIRLQQNE